MNGLSIVIPTLNEVENIPVLLKRISNSMNNSGIDYEMIFVDDHSNDGTIKAIKKSRKFYPLSFHLKKGSRGKAFSLLQGFRETKYNVICMIDADLQYPPEEIVPMYKKLQDSGTDMILTEREDHATSKMRQLSSRIFNLTFTRLLFGFNYDTQSGLKLFKKEIFHRAKLNPSPWSFDLEFIVRALENNYKILSHKIPFSARYSGEAKVRILKVTYELAKASLKLRFDISPVKLRRGYERNIRFAERVS